MSSARETKLLTVNKLRKDFSFKKRSDKPITILYVEMHGENVHTLV